MGWAQEFAAGKIKLLKRTGAVVLLLSLFFPMHSCTTYEESIGSSVSTSEQAQTQYYWAWTLQEAAVPGSYRVLLVFAWPAIALCLTSFAPRRRLWRAGLLVLETVLLGWTAYVLFFLGWAFGRPEAGAYIATSGFALYLIAWCVETFRRFRDGIGRIRGWRAAQT